MRRLLKFVLPLTLSASCASSLPAPNPIRPCPVPVLPEAPRVTNTCQDDPDHFCMTTDDVVALAKWVAAVVEIESSLHGCPLVTRVDQ